MRKLITLIITVGTIFFSPHVHAGVISDFFVDTKNNFVEASKNGNWNFYVPFYAWHNRLFYDAEHLSRYNEVALGIGIGKGFWDGNEWHGIVATGFEDSNYKLQTYFGYIYQYNWDIDKKGDFKVGLGYTLGFTQRYNWEYFPIPVPLPVVSLTYKQLSFQATYVPGVKNDGHILLIWSKYEF